MKKNKLKNISKKELAKLIELYGDKIHVVNPNYMNQKEQNLHDEYCNIQYLKNWLIGEIKKYDPLDTDTKQCLFYLKAEYKKACNEQIEVKKKLEKELKN